MSRGRRSAWSWLFAAAAALAVVAAIRFAEALPSGPEPIAWDREACAHCHMHVGEPRFAAQVQLADGQVANFDDPGCMVRYLDERRPAVHAVYVHHLSDERWLLLRDAAFLAGQTTPMGYGLGAVDASTPGALTLDAARMHIAQPRAAAGGLP